MLTFDWCKEHNSHPSLLMMQKDIRMEVDHQKIQNYQSLTDILLYSMPSDLAEDFLFSTFYFSSYKIVVCSQCWA